MDFDSAKQVHWVWFGFVPFVASCLFTGFGSVEVRVASVCFLLGAVRVFNDSPSCRPSSGNKRGLVSSPADLREYMFLEYGNLPRDGKRFFKGQKTNADKLK